MRKNTKIYSLYSGIPEAWWEKAETIFKDPPIKVKKLVAAFDKKKESSEGLVLYSQYGAEKVLAAILGVGVQPFEIRGLSYPEYFASKFAESSQDVPEFEGARVVFIYDVGDEAAVNTKFSAKILTALVKSLVAGGKWVVLVSDKPFSKFEEQYELAVKNKVSFPRETIGADLDI